MIEFWHNPRCSKSRQALAILTEAGAQITVRRYLEDPADLDRIKSVFGALNLDKVIDMMRPGEKVFSELGLSRDSRNAVLFAAMVTHPILIERPIAILGDRAIIGRPPEQVRALL